MKSVNSKKWLSFVQELPQIVPESWCLKCQICCRFPARKDVQTPTWSPWEVEGAVGLGATNSWFQPSKPSPSLDPLLQPCGSGYRCPAFQPEANTCSIYSARPLDCRLYPFVLTRNPGGTKVTLAMDMKCPFLQSHGGDPEVLAYTQKLVPYLESPIGLSYIETNPKIIGPSWPEFTPVAALPSLTAVAREETPSPHPPLEPLTLKYRPLIQEALNFREHITSSYTVASLFGWSDLIRMWWTHLEGALCIFAEQAGGYFMPLPPLGPQVQPSAWAAAWELLQMLNHTMEVSRIEGIESWQRRQAEDLGFHVVPGESEYLYQRGRLASLRGDGYRSQRWAINRLLRNTACRIRPFEGEDLLACLQLYTAWGIRRQREVPEPFSKSLIQDGLFFHRRLMMSWKELGLFGLVLEAEGKIRGYTFGAPVSPKTFCVFLEITDHDFEGSAQFLFREFCRHIPNCRWVNAMGDMGLPGLRQAKWTYRPIGLAATFSAVKQV